MPLESWKTVDYFNRRMEEDEKKGPWMFSKDCGVLITHASRGNDKHERERRDIRAHTRSVQVSDFDRHTDSFGMLWMRLGRVKCPMELEMQLSRQFLHFTPTFYCNLISLNVEFLFKCLIFSNLAEIAERQK